MKAYKIFNITPSGALRSYNIHDRDQDEELFSPLLLNYKPGKWRKPEIEGTGLFCLNQIPNYIESNCELWEVEAEGQIGFDSLVLSSEYEEEHVRELANKKQYARPTDLGILLGLFPNTVVYQRVKPLRKVS